MEQLVKQQRFTMDDEFELLDITLEMAKGTGVKVIAGAGSNDTATALTESQIMLKKKGLMQF